MNLALYCSVAEACKIAGVSRGHMGLLIRSKRVKAVKLGRVYAVLRSSAEAFEKRPGMGRPPKSAKKKPKK